MCYLKPHSCIQIISIKNTWNHTAAYKLFVLDRNTWNHMTAFELLELDINTWHHTIVYKLLLWYIYTLNHKAVGKLLVLDRNTILLGSNYLHSTGIFETILLCTNY